MTRLAISETASKPDKATECLQHRFATANVLLTKVFAKTVRSAELDEIQGFLSEVSSAPFVNYEQDVLPEIKDKRSSARIMMAVSVMKTLGNYTLCVEDPAEVKKDLKEAARHLSASLKTLAVHIPKNDRVNILWDNVLRNHYIRGLTQDVKHAAGDQTSIDIRNALNNSYLKTCKAFIKPELIIH